jgi:NAD(P)-dependent dehydrogenase (short-subunit alcohol dehydrogenase family)
VNTTDLQGRTFFVTGANSGLGRATVEALADRGGSVVLASRSEEKTRPVLEAIRSRRRDADLHFVPIDLADLSSVRRAAEEFLASGRSLDVLINNAGLAGARGLTKDGFEITIGTNHVGPFLLTALLLPALSAAPQGRIVNVSSRAHFTVKHLDWTLLERRTTSARSRFHEYAVSKLMNVLHAKELARQLAETRVTTYSVHPGTVASNIWRSIPWPIRPLMTAFMLPNEEGAKTQIYCATAPELSTASGRYYEKCREVPPSPLANDEALARELFARSEEAIIRRR